VNLSCVRWAVRGVLLLGVAASVVANVLHAVDNPISQCIAAWPPLALLLTVELISRVPVHSRGLAAGRIVAAVVIAGIAGWVSYWHMVGVAARYGEQGAGPYLLPFSVDGLIVVASICLVELAGRIRTAEPSAAARPIPAANDLEPVTGPPADPVDQPRTRPAARRVRPRALTVAERVAAAHAEHPDATHARVAELAGVSASSAKRYRPGGSPSGPDAAETVTASGSRDLVTVGSAPGEPYGADDVDGGVRADG
jgi:Protein of unknown function (DUF2637)